MCDMTHLYVGHDSFIMWYLDGAVGRTSSMSEFVTHLHVWRHSFIRVTWHIHMCDMTHSLCDISVALLGVLVRSQSSWRIYMCGVTHSCATWLIYMCDKTHSLCNILAVLLGVLLWGRSLWLSHMYTCGRYRARISHVARIYESCMCVMVEQNIGRDRREGGRGASCMGLSPVKGRRFTCFSSCVFGWVMPHTWMSHTTHMIESCRTHERAVCLNTSFLLHEGVMLHTRMSHELIWRSYATHLNESRTHMNICAT